MTVKPVINQDQAPSSMDAVHRRVSEKMKKVAFMAEEAEESGCSSTEEVESPKSVARFGRKKAGFVQHNQVLRVKEEEMMLFAAEDIPLMTKEPPATTTASAAAAGDRYPKRRLEDVDAVVFSRPILPCSPLSGKTDSKVGAALHH